MELIQAQAQDLSLLQSIWMDYGAHPASYSVGTGGSFSMSKAVRTWNWPITFNQQQS